MTLKRHGQTNAVVRADLDASLIYAKGASSTRYAGLRAVAPRAKDPGLGDPRVRAVYFRVRRSNPHRRTREFPSTNSVQLPGISSANRFAMKARCAEILPIAVSNRGAFGPS